MTVKDLLLQCDQEELLDAIMENECADEEREDTEDFRLLYEAYLLKLRDIEPEDTGHVLLYTNLLQFGESWEDASLFSKEEIAEQFQFNTELASISEDFDLNDTEITRICREAKLPTSYAYEFLPWAEILGYEISLPNVEQCGVCRFLALVLYEMTFFGFEESAMEEESEKLHRSIADFEEVMKLPEEEQAKHFVTFEEAMDEIGYVDERTEEEKRMEEEQIRRESVINRVRLYHVLEEYVRQSCSR